MKITEIINDTYCKIEAGIRKTLLAGTLAAAALFGANASAQENITPEQEKSYEQIYGQDEARLKKSTKKEDHFNFGKKLFDERLQEVMQQAGLEEVIEKYTIEHLKKADSREAWELIIKIDQDDLQDFFNNRDEIYTRLIADAKELLKRVPAAEKENRDAVNRLIADSYFGFGDFLEQKGKYAEAQQAFNYSATAYSSIKDEKSKEAKQRSDDNKSFVTEQSKLNGLADKARQGDKDANFRLAIESIKKGDYQQARGFLNNCDNSGNYVELVDFFTQDNNQRVTPNGLKESDVTKLKQKVDAKDARDLDQILLALTTEPLLENEGVIYTAAVQQGKIDWSALAQLKEKANKIMQETGRTPEFNVELATRVAGLVEEMAGQEQRIYVRADLFGKLLSIYNILVDKAQGTPIAAKAAIRKTQLEEELKKYDGVEVKGLELAAVGGVNIPKGAVLYMSFDNFSNNFRINGKPKIVKGVVDFAFELDGIDDYIEVPFSDSLNIKEDYTISFFARRLGNGGDDLGVMICKETNFDNRIFNIRWKNDGLIQFRLYSEGDKDVNSDKKYTDQDWHLISVVVKSNQMFLFLDGELQSSTAKFSSLPKDESSIKIGRLGYNANRNYHFNGDLDELYIFNRALSSQEIRSIYQSFISNIK